MRYWVYKDAQIVGPVDREQLASAVGLRADTLVCEEDASGGSEMNWRCAEELPELSGLYYSSAGAPPLDMPIEEYGLLERLQFETAGTAESEDWLGALFNATPAVGLRPTPADVKLAKALEESEKRVAELTEQLSQLTKRLEELEKAPRAAAVEPPPTLELPPAPGDAGERSVAPETGLPQLPQKQPLSLPPAKTFAPKPAEELPSLPSLAPKAEEPSAAAEPVAEAPAPEPVDDNPNRLKLGLPQKKGVQLGAAKTFKTVKREAPAPELPPALPAAPPPPPPAPVVEAAPPMPALQPAPAPAPTPAAPPPMTGWNTPAPATPMFAPQPAAMKPLEAPPIPSLQGATPPPADAPSPVALFTQAQAKKATEPPPIPHTQPPSMQPPATLVGPAAGAAGQPGPATKEVLARLAKPQAQEPAPAAAAPKPRSQKTFIIVGVAGILLVAVLGWLFLRNPEEVKTAVEMEPQPMGVVEAQPQQAGPQPMYQVQPPEQAAPPAAPPEPAFDPNAAAIDLVKGYPLDGDKGTIGQWLQFSYMSSEGTTERWDAGAVEATTYMVSYTVQPKGREAITYLFEADVTRGTVLGKNPLARELLAGGPPKPKAEPKKAPTRRRAVRKPAPKPAEPENAKETPLLPLPSDAELLPPAEEQGSFNSDTIQGGL